MSLTAGDFAEFLDTDPEADEPVPLGDALEQLANEGDGESGVGEPEKEI
jgi:hypothetical protein